MEHQEIVKTAENQASSSQASPQRGSPLHRFPSPLHKLQGVMGNRAFGRFIQAKLEVTQPGDAYEQEADQVADQVMRMTAPGVSESQPEPSDDSVLLHRKCGCESTGGGSCTDCASEEETPLHRSAASPATINTVPGILHDVLRSPGEPLGWQARSFMEPRFGHDFSQIRIHTGDRAAASAQGVNALAYTVGQNVVFGAGRYQPETFEGKKLLAHELTHVVQQGGAASDAASKSIGPQTPRDPHLHADSRQASTQPPAAIRKSAPTSFVARVNTAETATVLSAGTRVGSGVQFWPLQVSSTQIGPVSGQGGLVNDQRSRLSVLVGTSMTLRRIAELLLPLWNSATPFTPAGSTTPLVTPGLTADEVARGLLVYNRYYLRVLTQPAPAMTGWAGGLRFPLPVEIDPAGAATVNKDLIQGLATGFDTTWEPLLDQAAAPVVAPAPADLSQAVADFLTTTPDPLVRGTRLAARAITNAVETRPFALETFNQAGVGSFDIALAFMETLVNSQVSLLASQRDGAAILGGIRAALATAPTTLTARQQESLTRSNLMLGLVTAIVARNPPFASPSAISPAGAHMIAASEGFCGNLYDDATPNCGVGTGNCTIGFGHLVHLGPCNGAASETPFLGGLTRPAAEAMFANELTQYVNDVRNALTVPVSQAQFDALVSFHYNTGRMNALAPSINANNFAAVPGIMNQFVNARINGVMTQLAGLVTRRANESALFSTGVYPP